MTTPDLIGQQGPIKPQAGPQTEFTACEADIVIYGGAAGGGKTVGLLMECGRWIDDRHHNAAIFRRTEKQIDQPGGLWEESETMYPRLNGMPRASKFEWRFPSGAKVSFESMQYESDKTKYQGAQIGLICFDELTHFTASMFWYMMSRNRSKANYRPYIRATTNPDADSWVATLIDWWIDDDGFCIPERSGVIRWMIRDGDDIHWADSREALLEKYGYLIDQAIERMPTDEMEAAGISVESLIASMVKSFTFIKSSVTDNPALLMKDPTYMGNLFNLPLVDRERLLNANWKIRAGGGKLFQRQWFKIIQIKPKNIIRWVRSWDLAGTDEYEEGGGQADWTVGVLMGLTEDKQYVITDVIRERLSPGGVDDLIRQTAIVDGRDVEVRLPQDPGQAGKAQVAHYVNLLSGWPLEFERESKDKVTRAKPFSSQAEHGNVLLLEADWNEAFLSEHQSFPDGKYKDQVDAAGGGIYQLSSVPAKSTFRVLGAK